MLVPVGDLSIACRDTGSGDPVLLINGTGESGATWADLASRLRGARRTIAIDNRDTGESSYVSHSYAPKDLAVDAAGVIEALDLGACHVIGYSLGGAVAQELALARPELVRSMVLLSTWAETDPWFAAQMHNWKSIRRAHWQDEDAFLTALAPWLFSPVTFQKPGAVEGMYAAAAVLEKPQQPDGWMRQCDADIAHCAGGRLAAVRQPCLVIVGEDDICTPPRYSDALHALLAHSELVKIPNAAHAAVFERPDAVATAIEIFLARA